MLERDRTSSARALVSCAVMLGSIACGGSRFQSDDGSGGSSGAMGGTGKGGGASSGGVLGKGGTLGVSGGSSSGGLAGEPGAGGVPPGGGPSGGAGNDGGSMSGTGGFNVGGMGGGIGGGMSVSCATAPNCFECCRETIGNAAFVGIVYECGCSGVCNDVCLSFCEQGEPDQTCEFCINAEFENTSSSALCAAAHEQCDGNAECSQYHDCLSSCDP